MTNPRQDLKERAFQFSLKLLQMHSRLAGANRAHAHMAEQLFQAGTSIGALLEEAEVANSRRDLAAKLAIALREAREAKYWLRLFATENAWTTELAPLIAESSEFIAMLTVSVRKLRSEQP